MNVEHKQKVLTHRILGELGRMYWISAGLLLAVWLAIPQRVLAQEKALAATPANSGLVYTNYRVASVPWSIHVVRVDRSNAAFELHSLHAGGAALGLDTLSSQLEAINSDVGTPVAAVNGDFYQRDRGYAGDPRGLQISDGEVLSAPVGGAAFWIDSSGQPRLGKVTSKFRAVLPGGALVPFGLNEPRPSAAAVLYTPSVGPTTRAIGGRDLILENAGDGPWLPLRIATTYKARVRTVRETGNSPLSSDTMVLSLGPALARTLPTVVTGAVLQITTGTLPDLAGVNTAIGGGPALIQNGKRETEFVADQDGYEFSSMTERHPRTAIGWNSRYIFLVEVDGRQWTLSVGMTLDELSAFMAKFNCEQALNLDGGGSSTIWYSGKIRNRPCDGHERSIANSLVVVRKKAESVSAGLALPSASSSP